ncbi:MAG: AAA family ATPase [Limisphaerales bacterium]
MAQQNSIPRLRPVIRVFVSSTFNDMKLERNVLQEHVFPKLEQLCSQNGFQFQAIDLRWGVSSEAGLDHRTMRICLDELRRAQDISPEPNFLVLLGNRYGWRPLPEEISQVEFEKLAEAAMSGGENHAPLTGTHGKSARQVLSDWYRCDENVVVPSEPETSPDHAPLNYILQSRTQHLGDRRNYTRTNYHLDTQDWIDVQEVLWRIINTAFPAELLDHRFDALDWAQHVAEVNDRQHLKRAIPQIARFQASATEQEVWGGALSAPNAERHVLAFFRDVTNRTEFAPAEPKDFFDVTEAGEFDAASAKRQSDLKDAIKRRLGDEATVPIPFSRLKRQNDKVVVDTSEEDIRTFCESVENKLRPIIERQIEEYWHKSTPASPERAARELKIEQDEHERFGRERGGAETFAGRQSELQAVRDYLQNGSRWPLVVHGTSGCGKTALLWRAFEEIPTTLQPIIRLIGTTPHSSDVRSLLRSLCQKLRERNRRDGELPSDIRALSEELQEHFRSATPEQPLILLLDALDQLSDADNGRLLHWIPTGQLPGHVKLVVSCLSDRAKDDPAGQPFEELMRRQLPAQNSINMDVLSEDEARMLLFDLWLHKAGRTVNREQRERIEECLKLEQCRQPIYLKLLFEEIQIWHSYDSAPALGENVSEILGQFMERLGRPANHGRLLVERVLAYLAASHHGLAESEILEVLFADADYKAALDEAAEQTQHEQPASANRIPIAIWSRIRFDLAPYLTERAAPGANVLSFYHRRVAEWVQEHFVKASEHIWEPHRRLADYFERQPYRFAIGPSHRSNARKLDELPYQFRAAKCWLKLYACLTEPRFVESASVADGSAARHTGVYSLIENYRLAMEAIPVGQLRKRDVIGGQSRRDKVARCPTDAKDVLAVVMQILEKEIRRLTQFPELIVQQLYNEFVVFCGQPLIDDLRESFRFHLRAGKQGWVELEAVHGPGQRAWRSVRSVRTTEFPENLERFVPLPEDSLLALTSSGSAWFARISHPPFPVELPTPPRSDKCHLAACGSVVAYIDRSATMRFVQVARDHVIPTGATVPAVAVLVAVPSGFVAAGEDGTIYRFDEQGRRMQVLARVGPLKPEYLAASADGRRILLAKNNDVPRVLKSILSVIDLEQMQVVAQREADFDVRAATVGAAGKQFIIGTMMRMHTWDEPWDGPPKEWFRSGTVNQLVFSTDYRYLGFAGGNIILNDCHLGLTASVGPLGDVHSLGQILWAGCGDNAALHVGSGRFVVSWLVPQLPWAREMRSAMIEVALFDGSGEHFAGLGIAGEQFFWKVDTGKLLEFDEGGAQAAPYIEWCIDRRYGAICHRDRVEILDAEGAGQRTILDDTPAAACWDGEGRTLAYICMFDRVIRIVTFRDSRMNLTRVLCTEDYNPCAIALSLDGEILAIVMSELRMPVNYGLAGLGANIKFKNPFGAAEHIALFNLRTGERRFLLERYPHQLMGLRFLSESQILVWDAEGAVFVIETKRGQTVARWWAEARCVGIKQLEQEVLLADSGEATAHSPVVYRLKFHNLKEPQSWD